MRPLRALVALALATVWLVGLGAFPLLESTEGRYASIAAAMSRTGDFLEPRFDGLLHLDKPPLAYWAGAAALRLLPDGEFAVRLPATLAWVLACAIVARLALELGLDRRRALWAAAFAGLSPLAVAQGHLLSCDVFLWIGVLLFQLGWARGGDALLVGSGLGFGFLAKGPVVLMWTVLPALVVTLLSRDRRALAGLGSLRTWVFFALLGLPWYVVVALRHPGLVGFWLGRETAARYVSDVHGRAEPWWYFPALLPVLVLPWLGEAVRGVARVAHGPVVGGPHGQMEGEPSARTSVRISGSPSERALAAMAFAPFVFLCFGVSKRPNYLLPMLGPLALLAAGALPERRSAGQRAWIAVWSALVLVLPFVADRVPGAVPPTRALVVAARGAEGPLVAFRTLPSSLPFYAGDDVPVVQFARAAPFDPPEVQGRWAPSDASVLSRTLGAGGAVLARVRDEPAVAESAGWPLRRVAAAGELVLLRKQAGAAAPR